MFQDSTHFLVDQDPDLQNLANLDATDVAVSFGNSPDIFDDIDEDIFTPRGYSEFHENNLLFKVMKILGFFERQFR